MKRVLVFILGLTLFYGYLHELSLIKIAVIIAGLVMAFIVYQMPIKYWANIRYPFILLTFGLSIGLILYPHYGTRYPVSLAVSFISFYGLMLYLATLEEKPKRPSLEISGLSIILFSLALNLYMTGNPLLIFAIGLAGALYMYILGRMLHLVFISGYMLLAFIFLSIKGTNISGAGPMLTDINRWLILISSFCLLLIAFTCFIKGREAISAVAFVGALYIALDIFMVMGIKLSGGLLYQPVIAVLISGPILGAIAKAKEGAKGARR